MRRRWNGRSTRGLLLVLLALPACGRPADETVRSASETGRGAERELDAGVLPDTPPGGLEEWVVDIREGLHDLPALVARSGAAGFEREGRPPAEGAVLDLYLGRQEFIERYYGAGGPRAGGEALDAAVTAAEARFHEVLRLAGATPAPDTTSVRAALERLSAALDRVLREATEAGVPLDAPAGPKPGGEETPGQEAGETGAATERPEVALASLLEGVAAIEADFREGRVEEGRRVATRLYLDRFEPFEVRHGPGSEADPNLRTRVAEAEVAFHALLRADPSGAEAAMAGLMAALTALEKATRAGPTTAPERRALAAEAAEAAESVPLARRAAGAGSGTGRRAAPSGPASDRGDEIAAIRDELAAARRAFELGDAARALAAIEAAYLERFEPLEPRLAGSQVHRIERLFHLELRPAVARGEAGDRVAAAFEALDAELAEVEAGLGARAPFWFGAFNAFAIILREGLEAALLIAAILAYLAGVSADARHRRLVYGGALVGVAASFATWGVARSIVSVSGAGREVLEGITALLAVAVLLYVSHWLFHKSYVVDWTRYLRDGVGRAISKGSAVAMASLAFAAVYREGFETVLFYQALSFETGPTAVLAGFLPGLALIGGVGIGIVRMGIRLPMRRLFAITNAILLYLAFSFLGKGLYALQEAGWYAPAPAMWMPDRGWLRQLFGLYPVGQILAAQAAFVVLLGLTYAYYRLRARRPDVGESRAAVVTDSRMTTRAAPALPD